MSRFRGARMDGLTAYVPGEQPRDMRYIKLNTNESPFPPSEGVRRAVAEQIDLLRLYSDPDATALTQAVAAFYGVDPRQVLMTNGSDEILNFAFMAFGDAAHPFAFADVTYGFYPVFARLNGVPYRTIPLREDFSIDPGDYANLNANLVIANPNAPTGLALPRAAIEQIVRSNPDHVVVVDEAYVDFGGESCIPLVEKYDNLLVTRTFSKSFSLAGARLGFGVGQPDLIADLNTAKFSTNPYNVNRMTMAAGLAAIEDGAYYMDNCRTIIANREWTRRQLEALGFVVTDSRTNFLFAMHPAMDGGALYRALKARGILVRHFDGPRTRDYNRITIGTQAQMDALVRAAKEILEEANP